MGMQSVSIMGIGRLGGALALALSRAGYRIDTLVYRNPVVAEAVAGSVSPRPALSPIYEYRKISSDIVFITTSDPDIGAAAESLSIRLENPATVFHCSGSLSSEVLSGLRRQGCSVGSIHPLISVSDPFIGSEHFEGAYFSVEGDEKSQVEGCAIIETIQGRAFIIRPESKALYHAAAVTACGHVVALVDLAIEMLSACGPDSNEAKQILMPLIKSTFENLAAQSVEDALTGSFARGDVAAIERHLASLDSKLSAGGECIYLELGERSTNIAQRKGTDVRTLNAIRRLILIAKSKYEC